MAEINVRRQIFAPDEWGLGYVTVDGFTMKHAANTYSDFPGAPSRRQAGAISVHGGLKWIIQNNIIIHARTIAIDIGLGNDEWAGNRPGETRTHFHDTDKYGSHIVRNNYIAKAGQSGIAGVFSWHSAIMYNMIEDTNYRNEFSGAETAPIKVHYMNEGLIKGNYIKNSRGVNSAGIWTDWGNQNVRVTGNIVMNAPWGYYAEALHGPVLVDNNVFIGNHDIRMLDAAGVVYANNLFIDNGNILVEGDGRENYYFEPGTMNETNAMNTVQKFHWYNNLVRGSVLPSDTSNQTHIQEDNFTEVISNVSYRATNTEMSISFDLDAASISGLSLATQDRVGIIPNGNESIVADVTTDFFGNSFTPGHVMAGPFANVRNGANTFVLWPPHGQHVPTPPPPAGNSLSRAISTTYPKHYGEWENGLLAGDGKQGIIVFGNPLEETVIFNDRDFFMARSENRPHRTFHTVSEANIKAIRDLLMDGHYEEANQLAADVQGYQGGGEGSKHPGFKMTLTMPSNGEVHNYTRATDYSAGIVSVNWSDHKGDWERHSFVSRPDGVTVQYLPAPAGEKLDVRLQLDIDPGMNLLNKGLTMTNNSNTDFLNLRVKYPSGSYDAGYEGVTRIITDGIKTMDGEAVVIADATYVLLLSLTERYNGTFDGGVTAEQEWAQQLLQGRLLSLPDDYATLLWRHVNKHREIFDRVSIDFGASGIDRSKSNEQLLAIQKISITPVPALMERMFYSGRYHLLGSSSATAAPDLLGNWTGDSNVGWDGYYHLDANLNLQISSANIGNMPEAMEGYFYLNHQWQEDFRMNAQKLLRTRGMLTGGNTPNGEGLISNINFDYPYQYVSGGESWLLYPFWEHYQITGDLAFLEAEYYPLIRDMGDFYEDFLVEKDSNGHYIFAGSISPENRPAGGVPLSVNSVYDIAGARFALETLIETSTLLGRDAEQISIWQELLDNLPPYLINDDGALAEWAWPDLMNRNQYHHRHSSHMMPIWPYREVTADNNRELYEAARVSLQKKDGGNYEDAGHGLLHGALAAANLNDANSVNAKLVRFARDNYYYTSLATSHYNNHGVFATDVVNSVPAVMMEMLASTHIGTLELLPALPATLKQGSIKGMLGRSQFTIDHLSWDMDKRKIAVTLTPAIDQNLTLIQRAGIEEIHSDHVQIQHSVLGHIARVIPLRAGETVSIELTINAQ